jgi:hypothetical protein
MHIMPKKPKGERESTQMTFKTLANYIQYSNLIAVRTLIQQHNYSTTVPLQTYIMMGPVNRRQVVPWLLSTFIALLLADSTTRAQAEQLGPGLCDDGVTTGYNNAADLRADLLIIAGAREFTLCPSTVFDLSVDPLVISHSVILRCGDATAAASGENSINCILEGGENQIIVEGDISIIELYGLTFQTSTHMSVQVTTTDSIITFTNCRWWYHVGHSVVFIGESPPDTASDSNSNSTTTITNTTMDDQLNMADLEGLASTILENSTDQNFDDTPGMPTDPLPNDGTYPSPPDTASNSNITTTITNIAMDDQLNMTELEGLASTILENSTDPNFDDTPGMPTDPLPNAGTGDVKDVVVPVDPVIIENIESARTGPTRKRSHGGHSQRQLQASSVTTSVTFRECEFTVSSIILLDTYGTRCAGRLQISAHPFHT